MDHREPILIAGGGIAGLALSLALARRGIRSRILERRASFSEDGAGIQLGPNGVRILETLGVATALAPNVGVPETIAVTSGDDGRELKRLPLGRWIAERHGAPYWVAHRADLQRALLDAVVAEDLVEITNDFDVQSVEVLGSAVRVTGSSGLALACSVLVGADGIWSTVRAFVSPGVRPVPTGKIAMRAVVRRTQAEGLFSESAIGVWLAPGRHVVHYPVRGDKEIAVVVIAPGQNALEAWGRPVAAEAVRASVACFDRRLRALIERGSEWRAWPLQELDAPDRWSRGSVGLVGDAAHPVSPFLAQGGVMALEDSMVLAGLLAERETPANEVFGRFREIRMARVQSIAAAARRNGWIYGMPGPLAFFRNLALRMVSGERIMAGYDWVYGWRVD